MKGTLIDDISRKGLSVLAPRTPLDGVKAGILVILSIVLLCSTSWGYIRCSRGLAVSSGQCIMDTKDILAGGKYNGLVFGFRLDDMVSVQVEQGPETATPWAPVALVGRVLWNVLEWPSHTVTITLKPHEYHYTGAKKDLEGNPIKPTVQANTHKVLHPLGVHQAAAEEHALQLQNFLAGKVRSVQLETRHVFLPRLLALAAFLAALGVYSPTTAKGALDKAISLTRGVSGQFTAVQPQDAPRSCEAAFQWSDEACTAFDAALLKCPSGTPNRWGSVASIVGCSAAEAAARDKDLRAERNRSDAGARQQHAAPQVKAAAAASSKAELAAPRAELEWAPEEQKALERGLKMFGSDDPQRWEKIAGEVGTRSKGECVKRYKAIVQAMKSKKKSS